MKIDQRKLRLWQERLQKNQSAYDAQVVRMDEREAIYRGSSTLRGIVEGEKKTKTPHVRNVASELIEAQINSNLPKPKVTAMREEDEMRAKLIEDMLRGEMDRMPLEEINDMLERTVPIQGGALLLVEWDNTKRTHTTVGELVVSAIHPKQVIPQDGVYTGIEEMDYIILKLPQTKESIKRKFGVNVELEDESEPDVKNTSGDAADDLVTQYVAYYRNERGGIGLYSWVNDTELVNLEDYQARRLRRCSTCGAIEGSEIAPIGTPTMDGTEPEGTAEQVAGACPYCGGTKFEDSTEEYEELYLPVRRSDGGEIPASMDAPVRIPFYKPNIYPVILQKNVSVFGQFLGESDIDKIQDQQNTSNRIEAKIIDKLLKSGSYITLPDAAEIEVNADDMKIIRPGSMADKQMIDVYDMQGNVTQDLRYLSQVYEEARQIIGITDSFQGRADRTATSGVAKEFSAAQAAGRLESKKIMKHAAWAWMFHAMFQFKLAYTDEPRPIYSYDIHGNKEFKSWNRYDFLEQDEAGEWYWNDRFLFSCDDTAPLASNREAMWQETRLNLQTGAFGDPTNSKTLILFWTKMEMLHYPGAGETKAFLESELARQEEQAQKQVLGAPTMPIGEPMPPMQAGTQPEKAPEIDEEAILAKAQADAARDAGYPGTI